jgi:hypothetical protein
MNRSLKNDENQSLEVNGQKNDLSSRYLRNNHHNGTAHFKNVNNCLNANIYSYLETSSGQSSNQYLNVVHFFNTSVK